MKKIATRLLLFITTFIISALYSCNKSLDLKPLDQLSSVQYWQTANDFKQFANQFYTWLPNFGSIINDNPHHDLRSDFLSGTNDFSQGTNTLPVTDNTWTSGGAWGRIRSTNILLQKAQGFSSPDAVKVYVAEAKFFRAYIYFDLLEQYGGVPIISKALDNSSPELQAPRNTRDEVADFIIKDLNEAIIDLPVEAAVSGADKGRVSKGAAQAFLGRVALYEGTWQKTMATPNNTRANTLFDIAIKASNEVINSAQYALFGTAASPGTTLLGDSAQKYMFILENPKSNPTSVTKTANKEYVLATRFDVTKTGNQNISHTYGGAGVSRTLANLYLCKDGLPVDKSPLFQGYATHVSEFQNRDNRMRYTLMVPGRYYWKGNANGRVNWTGDAADRANVWKNPYNPASGTGYANQKFLAERVVPDFQETYDYPVIRYAEVLLIYAEAVFERNNFISDADLDKSLNLVRRRINGDNPSSSNNMPKLSNGFVAANGLDMRTEIRRERSVEFYLENMRTDDLKRWHIAQPVLKNPVLGIKWTGTQYQTSFPGAASISKYTGGNITTSYNTNSTTIDNGCIILSNQRIFSDRNYLLPIPTNQIKLNPNLQQNPGW